MDIERFFNTTGPCFPERHYMVPPLPRLKGMMRLIKQGQYFVIHSQVQAIEAEQDKQAANDLYNKALAYEADQNYRKASLYYKDLIQHYPDSSAASLAKAKLNNLKIKRYVAYPDGTAKDTVTGLGWMRCSVGQTWTGSGGSVSPNLTLGF